ncbi:MAG: alpha/beta fold hydrolase [Actinomycetota bacterium]|nr:alpha/beta fold hydrolase [Actinomycetota bacterium]
MTTITIDGRPVAYRERGDGGGTPLLLLHGFTGSKEDFDAVVDGLAADRRVVAVDLPGHGGSAGSDDPAAYGIAATAGWVLRAAEVFGLGEFGLLGHSLGGLVAQRVASTASQRLRCLVLADTGVGALREEAAEVVVRIALAARDRGMAAAWEEIRRRADAAGGLRTRVVPQDPAREVFVRRRFLGLRPAVVVGTARALIGAVPLGAFLRGIDIPVLVVAGEDDDTWTVSEQRLLAALTAGAQLAVVPDAVHVPQLENPGYWLKVVRDFLARADADPRRVRRSDAGR